MSFTSQVANAHNRTLEAACLRKGYYLVLPSGERHFISPTPNESALTHLCDKHLTAAATGWQYWIDYSYGPSVTGAPAWDNLDHTDRFI